MERRLTPERALEPSAARYTNYAPRAGSSKTFLEQRREQRAAQSHVSIWPPSPERSPSPSSLDKDRKRKRKHHSKKHHRRHRRRRSTASLSDDDDERRAARTRHAPDDDERDEWTAKTTATTATIEAKQPDAQSDSDDDGVVGPQPAPAANPDEFKQSYGGALLKGEGDAMAAFLASGQRIPRRGEIGLAPDAIERFEQAGYVMSGSRHRRMNAVRVRKENQVISAEEKRSLLNMQKEEKLKRETEIVASFKELVDTKLSTTGTSRGS